jgi:hypothetical protein
LFHKTIPWLSLEKLFLPFLNLRQQWFQMSQGLPLVEKTSG